MATRTISNEQKSSINPVKINAIYPGVVATGMQSEIRKTSELDFKNVQRFIDLKNNNELFQPKYVADKIFQLDINNLLENGAIVDIRNL
jgi:benzil reductase ((S)-benzoin forming)